jgi:hypothetical protein
MIYGQDDANAKSVWETINKQRPRMLDTFKSGAKGAIDGGLWGATLGSVAGPGGTAAGAIGGAALGATFQILTDKTKKLIDGWQKLTDMSKQVIQSYSDVNATFKKFAIEWEMHERKQRRAWAAAFEPIIRSIHDATKQFDAGWQSMKRSIFEGLKPFITDIITSMKKWLPTLLKGMEYFGDLVKWLLRVVWALKQAYDALLSLATGKWLFNLIGKSIQNSIGGGGAPKPGSNKLNGDIWFKQDPIKDFDTMFGLGGTRQSAMNVATRKDSWGTAPTGVSEADKRWAKVEQIIRDFFDVEWWWKKVKSILEPAFGYGKKYEYEDVDPKKVPGYVEPSKRLPVIPVPEQTPEQKQVQEEYRKIDEKNRRDYPEPERSRPADPSDMPSMEDIFGRGTKVAAGLQTYFRGDKLAATLAGASKLFSGSGKFRTVASNPSTSASEAAATSRQYTDSDVASGGEDLENTALSEGSKKMIAGDIAAAGNSGTGVGKGNGTGNVTVQLNVLDSLTLTELFAEEMGNIRQRLMQQALELKLIQYQTSKERALIYGHC